MRGLNKVTLIGNIGKDPDIQLLDNNIKVAKVTLATTETFRNANGQVQSSTDWHSLVLWRGLAELAEKYLRKGSLVYVEGKLKNRSFDDKDGQKRYVTEIIVEQVLKRERLFIDIPRPKKPLLLPNVLAIKQVELLFSKLENLYLKRKWFRISQAEIESQQ